MQVQDKSAQGGVVGVREVVDLLVEGVAAPGGVVGLCGFEEVTVGCAGKEGV